MSSLASKKRIDYIDALKGIGILWVVLGHAINSSDVYICRFLWAFHMPLFFFASGLVRSERAAAMPFGEFFVAKCRTLLLPHMVMAGSLICFDMAESVVIARKLVLAEIDFLGPLMSWFLPVLFIIEIIWWIRRRLLKQYAVAIGLPAELLVFLVCSYQGIVFVQQVLAGMVFLDLGTILAPHIKKVFADAAASGRSKAVRCVAGAALLMLTAVLTDANIPIQMYINQYGNKLLFILTGMCGVMAMLILARMLEAVRLIKHLGENTIIIFVTHFLLYRVLKWGCVKMVAGIRFTQPLVFVPLFIAVSALELPIVYLANRFVPFLFGKKRNVA